MRIETKYNIKRLLSFNTIKKYFPLWGVGGLFLLVACSPSDDDTPDRHQPITFSCSDGDQTTRAGEVGLSEFISDFKVYGVNGDIVAGDFVKKNTIFPNYQVWHTENMENTTSTNTSDWEYVGTVEGAMGTEEQTIKFWDEKHEGHYFWAIGNYSQRGGFTYTEPTALPDEIVVEGLTQENVKDAGQCLYFTNPKYVPRAEYGRPVKLVFQRYCSRIRIGFYEAVEEHNELDDKTYKVVGINFYKVNATDGTFITNEMPTTTVCLKGDYAEQGNVKLSYTHAAYNGGADGVTTETVATEKSQAMEFGNLNIVGTESGVLPNSSSQALFTTLSGGSQYVEVMPYRNESGLSLQCDIVVRTGNRQYTQQNVRASIPAHYTDWKPNQSYTYIFKIVTKPDGIAVILANVEVKSWVSDGMIEKEWHNW